LTDGECAVRRLLYIEDNEDNLYMLQLWFDVLGGYEILGARDGAAGIAMAAAERPDLILMDLAPRPCSSPACAYMSLT
jgi:CheY-like chemotaxis protein